MTSRTGSSARRGQQAGHDAKGGLRARRDGEEGAAPRVGSALVQAAGRVRRALLVVTALLVAGDAGWALLGDLRRPVVSFLLAAAATALLLASVWLVLERMVRSGPGLMVAWVGGGYLLRVLLLGVVLVAARVAGADTRMVGLSLIVGILAGMACETAILARARVPTVEPGSR